MNNSLFPIPTYTGPVPHLSIEQMIEVDRLMIEKYHIELIQMMENAGRALALLAKSLFLQGVAPMKVVVLAGTGGNGGGALVAARRLSAWGYEVSVYLTHEERMRPIPRHQLDILKLMKLSIGSANDLKQEKEVGCILDGIIGYSLSGNPKGSAKAMIEWANRQVAPTLSLDTPSGVDLTHGIIHQPSIQAAATLTLALPKRGLSDPQVETFRGELYLADISVPPSLYEPLGIAVPSLFKERDIIRLA